MSICKNPLDFLLSGYYATRRHSFWRNVNYNEGQNEYVNSSVFRGFPAGNIGSGGFGIDTAGGFRDIRINNNWMAPIKHAKGSFWAVSSKGHGERYTRILRKNPSRDREYRNIEAIQDVRFKGDLPTFTQKFHEPGWALDISIDGLSPFIPNDARHSALPVTVFHVRLTNRSDEQQDVSVLFSWENVLGCGGTGQTGLKLSDAGYILGYYGRLLYDERDVNYQEPAKTGALHGIRYCTEKTPDKRSHQRSVTGQYLLLSPVQDDDDMSYCLNWDANEPAPLMLEEFKATGCLSETSAVKNATRPAAALAISAKLASGETKTVPFYLVWWTPDHVTEPHPVTSYKIGQHNGKREGHYYENAFDSPDAMAEYVARNERQLWRDSQALPKLVHESDYPLWLKTSLINAVDSVICNSVLPQNGCLHTLEGMDWRWFFGGLTGTNDQRLSSHPYTATFFPELDKTEVDSFRQLSCDGEVPHGNGNCDLGLYTADVPYGWPLKIAGSLDEDRWPDLIMSNILQTYRLAVTTGDRAWLQQCWPDFMRMLDKLNRWSRNDIPEGGTTYDTFSFPGTFIYTATLYLATLKALQRIAALTGQPEKGEIANLREKTCHTIESTLWNDEHGFYRTTDQRDTIFAGAMAGDWFARYAGLGPVLPSHRVAAHLKHAYNFLIRHRNGRKGPCAFPDSEARIDGSSVVSKLMGLLKVHGYTWQFISYLGYEFLYLGMWEEGLHTLRIPYERIWHGGWPWSADLWGNSGSVYMTHPVIWALPYAMTGFFLDVINGTLQINTDQLENMPFANVPVCFPQCWMMVHREDASSFRIEVQKHFGEPVSVERLLLEKRNGQISEGNLPSAIALDQGFTMRFTTDGTFKLID